MSGKRRPPKRRCPGCGGDYYAWAEGSACRRCLAEGPGPVTTFGNVPAGATLDADARRRARAANEDLDRDDIPY